MSHEDFRPAKDLFVITEKDAAALNTPVFSIGDNEEAVAVFLNQSDAKDYIKDAGWSDSDVAAELTPQAIVEWLVDARRDGPTIVVVNPKRDRHEAGERLQTIAIDDLLSTLGAAVVESVISRRTTTESTFQSITVYRCLHCDQLETKRTGKRTPTCHNEPMVVDSLETRALPKIQV